MKGLKGAIHTSFFSWQHSSFVDGKFKLKEFKSNEKEESLRFLHINTFLNLER